MKSVRTRDEQIDEFLGTLFGVRARTCRAETRLEARHPLVCVECDDLHARSAEAADGGQSGVEETQYEGGCGDVQDEPGSQ